MGWWWSSAPSQPQSLPNGPSDAEKTPSAAPTPAPEPKSTPMTRDEQAEAEFKQFLAGLQDSGAITSQTDSRGAPFAPSTHAEFDGAQDDNQSGSIAPESLYPTSMSCRSAFDYAFFCQSFGGQWVNVYRYGELRSCSEQWSDFWLCMRSQSYPEESKRRMISDHYRKKATKYRTGPSSEDIWEVRKKPLEGAFEGDFAALERQMKEQEDGQSQAQGQGS